MGLFDSILWEQPLPDFPPELNQNDFDWRTKDFGSLMETFKVDARGQFWREKCEYKMINDDAAPLGFYCDTVSREWIRDNYTGEVEFGCYIEVPKEYKEQLLSGEIPKWKPGGAEYKAVFVEGRLTSLNLVSFDFPRPYTDEEIENIRQMREEMALKKREYELNNFEELKSKISKLSYNKLEEISVFIQKLVKQ